MAKNQAPRNFTRYIVKVKNKNIHGGITERPLEERAKEHEKKWPNCHVVKVGPKVSEEAARKWEEEHGYS